MVKTLILSAYTYETWTLRKADIRMLEPFEVWLWRHMEKVCWTADITNAEILDYVKNIRADGNDMKKKAPMDRTCW